MATNIFIDSNLLEEALKIGGLKTTNDTINQALKEFIEKRKQQAIIDLFGKMSADPKYEYKKGRRC